jgi:hypothetical protein
LGSKEFTQYRERVLQRYPPGTVREALVAGGCATGEEFEMGFDHAMYQYRQIPDVFEYTRHILSKFVYTSVIQNLCQSAASPQVILKDNHDAFLIHSGWNFKDKNERMVMDTFEQYFDHTATSDEIIRYRTRLEFGEIASISDLVSAICSDQNLWTVIPTCQRIPEASRPQFNSESWWRNRFGNQYYMWNTDLHSGKYFFRKSSYKKPSNNYSNNSFS